ncbi:MAG: hypothetical protein IJZ71_01185 [Treponema sp.]|nr:hypothetical protein [Treponema sp.]
MIIFKEHYQASLKGKKILLIGNPSSPYIMQYIENVLKPLGFDVFMQFDYSELSDDVRHFYTEYKINQILFFKNNDKKIFLFPFIGKWIKRFYNFNILNRYAPYDFIHVQYVTFERLMKNLIIKKSVQTKLFASFWGSDLLRVSDRTLLLEKIFLRNYNYITADSYSMVERYNKFFGNTKNKLDIVYYGVSLIPYIDRWLSEKKQCINDLSIPKDKIVISIGYNGRPQQQHDKVINVLNVLENKKNYFLLIQSSYGNEDVVYKQKLKTILDNSGFQYKIISNYLTMDELAKLRVITDIFINAQTTDAFCNSIKEYMYSKTQIINASWLHYPEIDTLQLKINEFSNFDQIPSLLEKQVNEEELEWNREIIGKNSSWETCRQRWAKIYGINDSEIE